MAAPLVGEEAAVVEVAGAAIAADEMAAIVPGPVLVLGIGIDLNSQHLVLMTEVVVALVTEEIEGFAPGYSRTEGEIEHEADMMA